MSSHNHKEFTRQCRVARMMLSMHCILRDRYARRLLVLRCLMLSGSVLFCATAFAGDDVFNWLGVPPAAARFLLKSLSVLSFVVSLVMLLVGWDAATTRHADAAKRFTDLVAAMRRAEGDWATLSEGKQTRLFEEYWDTCQNTVPVSTRHFASLKSRYLRDVTVSRLLDRAPGCPVFVLKVVVMCRAIWHGVRAAHEIPMESRQYKVDENDPIIAASTPRSVSDSTEHGR